MNSSRWTLKKKRVFVELPIHLFPGSLGTSRLPVRIVVIDEALDFDAVALGSKTDGFVAGHLAIGHAVSARAHPGGLVNRFGRLRNESFLALRDQRAERCMAGIVNAKSIAMRHIETAPAE